MTRGPMPLSASRSALLAAAASRRARDPPGGRAARRRRPPRTRQSPRAAATRAPRRRTPVTSTSASSRSSPSARPTACARSGSMDRMQARLQVLGGVGGIGRAVEEAAEQAVALLANRADPLQHAIERHAEQQQRVRREHEAAFEHLRHDLGRRPRCQQAIELGVVERAHDHRQLRAAPDARGAGS